MATCKQCGRKMIVLKKTEVELSVMRVQIIRMCLSCRRGFASTQIYVRVQGVPTELREAPKGGL